MARQTLQTACSTTKATHSLYSSCRHELAQGRVNVAAHQPDGHGPELWPIASDALAGGIDSVPRILLEKAPSFSRDGSNPQLDLSLLAKVGKRRPDSESSPRQ